MILPLLILSTWWAGLVFSCNCVPHEKMLSKFFRLEVHSTIFALVLYCSPPLKSQLV